ncbi:hypothetical protein [uncultured Caulobacter sp.]|nr:hypothetical protein [uncultured Caulobacter sp.]
MIDAFALARPYYRPLP